MSRRFVRHDDITAALKALCHTDCSTCLIHSESPDEWQDVCCRLSPESFPSFIVRGHSTLSDVQWWCEVVSHFIWWDDMNYIWISILPFFYSSHCQNHITQTASWLFFFKLLMWLIIYFYLNLALSVLLHIYSSCKQTDIDSLFRRIRWYDTKHEEGWWWDILWHIGTL